MQTDEQTQEETAALTEQAQGAPETSVAENKPSLNESAAAEQAPSASSEAGSSGFAAASQPAEPAQTVTPAAQPEGEPAALPAAESVAAADAPQTATDSTEEPFELVPTSDFKQIVETLLFITDRPLKPSRIAEVIEGVDARRVREMILEIQSEYVARARAVQIIEVGGGFQMSTKSEYGRWVRRLYNEKMTAKLSNAALETLAIISYKQPLTRAEMEAIRGVDVAGPLERLLERGLVRVVGKKDTIGRPMVYGTTDEFLRMFGLNKISELPDLQVFAAKTLHERQEDLPFGDPLPPLAEPAIIPLDELEGEEKLEALDASADPFFTRTSYNRGDFFSEESATPENLEAAIKAAEENSHTQNPETAGEQSPFLNQDEDPVALNEQSVIADNELAALQTAREEEAVPAVPEQEEK